MTDNCIVRRKVTKSIKRRGKVYYGITQFLRENPPTEKTFTIKQIAKEIGTSKQTVYLTLRNCYNRDNSNVLCNIMLENGADEEAYDTAMDYLHEQGFYYVRPINRSSGLWKEPSYYEEETYLIKRTVEHLKCLAENIEEARALGYELGTINSGRELEHIRHTQKMLESF